MRGGRHATARSRVAISSWRRLSIIREMQNLNRQNLGIGARQRDLASKTLAKGICYDSLSSFQVLSEIKKERKKGNLVRLEITNRERTAAKQPSFLWIQS